MNVDFFTNLDGVHTFADACKNGNYTQAPDDWLVVITDIQGSTKAIENGRYKDINMIGAACITAVVNTCEGLDIPYVFGGDGATFLIPPTYLSKISAQLSSIAVYAQQFYGLTLRCGAVPILEISKAQYKIGVAKYIMPTGLCLAMFNGGGVSYADNLIKENPQFSIHNTKTDASPNLNGLSCRWQPLHSQRGVILTMLVLATSSKENDGIYSTINESILDILDQDYSPVSKRSLFYKWPGFETLRQSQIAWRSGQAIKGFLSHVFEILMFQIMQRFHLKFESFDPEQYTDDIILNSDYRKFDDTLRMVIDCSAQQAEKIEEFLEKEYQNGHIVYGTQYSDKALMTCFVEALEKDQHVHFIDGDNGGYALAAKKMKDQMKLRDAI